MTDNTENPAPEPSPRRNNKVPVIIAFMAIVIIIQAIKIYLDTKEKQEVRTQLITTEEELATTMQRLTEINSELDEKIAQVTKLGGDVTDLQQAKSEIEEELRRNKRATGKEIKALKAQLQQSQQKAQLFEAVIDVLRKDYGVRIVKKPSGKSLTKPSSKG